MKTGSKDIKAVNKIAIAQFIYKKKTATRQDIAIALGMSLPTILQNIKELEQEELIEAVGQQHSTGGRKAVEYAIVSHSQYAIGMNITKHHLTLAVVDLSGACIGSACVPFTFTNDAQSFTSIANHLEDILHKYHLDKDKILGVGISIAGIVDQKNNLLYRSHILDLKHMDLQKFAQYIPYPLCFDNDANNAAYAQVHDQSQANFIFLSLEYSIGGAIYFKGEIEKGDSYKAGEFGHMVIVPDGKSCYCGKKGCFDAYCSQRALLEYAASLDEFFERLAQHDETITQIWEEYLDHLALMINNLRMAFDTDVILGGSIRAFIEPYLISLCDRVNERNTFETLASYIKLSTYKTEAAAIGGALRFIDLYFTNKSDQ